MEQYQASSVEEQSGGQSVNVYVTIWVWLVALLIMGLAVFSLPIPKSAAVVLIFAIAAIKAGLVARNYMHLKSEYIVIYFIALVPLALVIGMVLTLIPDIAMRR